MIGVSFVIPVRNGGRWLDSVLTAVRGQTWPGPIEIIAIDDGSTDDSGAILLRHQSLGQMRVLEGDGSGAAAAINRGIRAATHPLIAQVDQDVVIAPTWLARLGAALDDPNVAAAQGRYVSGGLHEGSVPLRKRGQTPRDIWSRVMALDLALRYRRLASTTNHVCTGNTLYRRAALLDVGLFDEDLGYGYDNDLSYRLSEAGYRLAYRHDAESVHHWREGVGDYVRQQYGFGYGRLNLLTKHPNRGAGDSVSGLGMMLQAPVTAAVLVGAAVAPGAALWLAAVLAAERFIAGLRAAFLFRDSAGLFFVPVHAIRNLAWLAATTTWTARTLAGVRPRPVHSMRSRRA